ncbi:hypothetical protein JEP92_23130 [Serratia surfactantfaciens]|uniref:hypothetical protein n=1 Tax=Serratia surfactantfaciens TaxID=2741499 RepID=UPI0018E47073|nr:hypothetical protein [Serratia surfactantfaciens]MBI6154964.1 hypothetical protein [Serratia surfactantfaciens]
MVKELRIRTEGYENKNTKIYLDEITQEEGEISIAMIEDTDGDGIINIVHYVGDIDGDLIRDKYDEKILRDLGNSIMKIKL